MNPEYKVFWTSSAEKDLLEIGKYIAKDNVEIALKKMALVEEKVKRLSYFANEGRFIPELLEYENNKYREILVYPWRVIYNLEEKNVIIIMVIDGRRNLQDILYKKLMK
ncbi:toxin ParE1/3/4 [Alkalispirochaeta americana]|uniref:Toxin ParE1/3/4 n=1 Tax=Alkalispirochaeta americana TaxID=159291 RepID=A0A1N6Q9U6_9SPIO|nr:type II toxin-antitoxin system RelE/ParE family toxin [Alkalispirochaeta americana]SIQ13423.1 toxin ParE1/3/4 [Alkalispirochaeta americana]